MLCLRATVAKMEEVRRRLEGEVREATEQITKGVGFCGAWLLPGVRCT